MEVNMIDQQTLFWMNLEPWLTISGMTIIAVSIIYGLFRIYKFLSPQEQFSSKTRKIALISGLAVISLGAILPWLYVVGVLTVFAPK